MAVGTVFRLLVPALWLQEVNHSFCLLAPCHQCAFECYCAALTLLTGGVIDWFLLVTQLPTCADNLRAIHVMDMMPVCKPLRDKRLVESGF